MDKQINNENLDKDIDEIEERILSSKSGGIAWQPCNLKNTKEGEHISIAYFTFFEAQNIWIPS